MTSPDLFEARIEQALRDYADRAVMPFDPGVVAERAMDAPSRPSWYSMVLVPALLLGLLISLAVGLATLRPPTPAPLPSDSGPVQGGQLERAVGVGHNAVRLLDGRLFVFGGTWVGGAPFGGPTSAAEIWDPLTGESDPALATPANHRAHATATLLTDGRVLVVGGFGGLAYPDSAVGIAELWDPATGEFEETGALAHPRVNHTATLLRDGRVLIAGGGGGGELVAEVYDPERGEFLPAGELSAPRWGHTATALLDGRVLLVGGTTQIGDHEEGNVPPIAASELWDPATSSFSAAGELAAPRTSHTATLLSDGRVLVVGGTVLDPEPSSLHGQVVEAELWDPETRSFVAAGSLNQPRHSHTATLLSDGRVALIGGTFVRAARTAALVTLDSVEIWQPETMSFVAGPSLDEPRSGHTATPAGGDQIVLIGGGGELDALSSIEVWRHD